MKKINCNIITDVLPLYVDDVVSDETKEMVEEHLKDCEECNKEFKLIKQEVYIPAESEVSAIKNFKKKWRNKKLIISGISILLTGIILFGLSSVFNKEIVQDLGERAEISRNDDILYYSGTNFWIRDTENLSESIIPGVNNFDFTLDIKDNIVNAKFIFPAKQYKSSTDGKIEFKVDLENEKVLFINVDEFNRNKELEKLELSENEIIELSKWINKRFMDHIKALDL